MELMGFVKWAIKVMSQARVPIFPYHLGLALLGTPFEVCTPLGHAGIMSSKISCQVYQQLFKKC